MQTEKEPHKDKLVRLLKSTTMQDLVASKRQPADIQTILLEVYSNMVQKYSVAEVFRQSNSNRFVSPSEIGQKEMNYFDSLIYSELPESFEDIESAPIAPLGSNSVLTKVSQNTVLSTVKNVEVVGDPTVFLAIESAKRRKDQNDQNLIDLATSHRCIRLQKFEPKSGFMPHFRAFALSTAGRYRGWFEVDQFFRHAGIMLKIFNKLTREGFAKMTNLKVSISNILIAEKLLKLYNANRKTVGRHTQDNKFRMFDYLGVELPGILTDLSTIRDEELKQYGLNENFRVLKMTQDNAISKLKSEYPDVHWEFDLERIAGIGYYNGLCYKISAENINGKRFPLVDGGKSDWVAQLLSNHREHFFSSGFGSELFYKHYIMEK